MMCRNHAILPSCLRLPRPENAVLQLAVLLGNLESLQQPLELGVEMRNPQKQ